MDQNYTDITLIVDRSGSMASIRDDAQGGINTFIKEQAAQPGKCTLTLVQFDQEYNVVVDGKPINEVAEYTLTPRGSTALLDAVGRAINTTGERLASMREEDRPGLVSVVIVTDGQENASQEFTKERIKQIISHQQDVYNWQFTFLGADQDAFAEADSMGIHAAGVAQYDKQKSLSVYSNTSAKMSRMRKMSMSGQEVDNSFTSEERDQMA
jgi:Mg-chelatase subunit ChlD